MEEDARNHQCQQGHDEDDDDLLYLQYINTMTMTLKILEKSQLIGATRQPRYLCLS